MIHATALVDPGAKIGANVEIGPYSIIGPHVEIGDNTVIVKENGGQDLWAYYWPYYQVLDRGCCVPPACPASDAYEDRGVWKDAPHGGGTEDSASALATEVDDRVLIAANEPPEVDTADAIAANDLASGL